MRADEALVKAGLARDLSLARSLIMEGRALYADQRLNKPSDAVKRPELLRIKGAVDAYVSRGAHKLQRAFELFDISARDRACIDIGASTGGFTDVMLRHGARRVFCVDVGYNLLDWKLRSDPRVTCMERTNARFLSPDMLGEVPEFGATDVSFISLKAVLPAVQRCLCPGADFIALVKPQFEAAQEDVGPKGVVTDAGVHARVIGEIAGFCAERGFCPAGLGFSPVTGPEGNIEFLLWLKNAPGDSAVTEALIQATVREAHARFGL